MSPALLLLPVWLLQPNSPIAPIERAVSGGVVGMKTVDTCVCVIALPASSGEVLTAGNYVQVVHVSVWSYQGLCC